MQTQDEQAGQGPQRDPAQVALDAINDFDRYVAEHDVESVGWGLAARAELRVAWALMVETRKQNNLLTSVIAKLNVIEYNTRNAS